MLLKALFISGVISFPSREFPTAGERELIDALGLAGFRTLNSPTTGPIRRPQTRRPSLLADWGGLAQT